MSQLDAYPLLNISEQVCQSIQSDVHTGDITAGLIDENCQVASSVIVREPAVICGAPWFDEVFRQMDSDVQVDWLVEEGANVTAGQAIVRLSGASYSILAGERCALNWLQTLSGTATTTKSYVELLKGTGVQLLDTRKTIPGLRYAQKYAVTIGGGRNHRLGLYDAFLIKENHIMSAGGISAVIKKARIQHPDKPIEIEVETLDEFDEAQNAGADIVMLDNFTLNQMREAVSRRQSPIKLEVSGNVNIESCQAIARTGVDFISVGAITKDLKVIDFSMRFCSA